MRKDELVAAARRRLPAATVPLRVRAGVARDLRDPRTWEQARRSMELLLGAARPEADLDAKARAYLGQMRWLNEARWHLKLWGPLRVEGLEHLRDVPGGVYVNWLHHGPFPAIGTSLAQAGRTPHIMANPELVTPRLAWQRQTRAIAGPATVLFGADEGSAGIRSRLEQGLMVAAACDVPGRTPVSFLGRQLVGSSGSVRAAWTVGAPVVSCTTRVDPDGRPYYQLLPALDPRDFATAEDLLQELLGHQEEAVLAWPEGYYDPLTKWSTAAHLLRGSS